MSDLKYQQDKECYIANLEIRDCALREGEEGYYPTRHYQVAIVGEFEDGITQVAQLLKEYADQEDDENEKNGNTNVFTFIHSIQEVDGLVLYYDEEASKLYSQNKYAKWRAAAQQKRAVDDGDASDLPE